MALGDYVKTTFVEGSAPGISAARLNNNEDKTAELDQAFLTTQTDFNAHLADLATTAHAAHVKGSTSVLVAADGTLTATPASIGAVNKAGDTMTDGLTAPTFASNVATGTAPLTVASTTAVTNLNADMVDGLHASQLTSASGAWTPASGTFNVAAGTYIIIAAIPSGAKLFMIQAINSSYGNVWGFVLGAQTWSTSAPYSSTAQSVYAATNSTLYDGSYSATGNFQFYQGYLQFYVSTAPTASTATGSTVLWGVA